jgi:hypothetical protein
MVSLGIREKMRIEFVVVRERLGTKTIRNGAWTLTESARCYGHICGPRPDLVCRSHLLSSVKTYVGTQGSRNVMSPIVIMEEH